MFKRVYKTYTFSSKWKNVGSMHFQHFNPFFSSFSWQTFHLKNVDVYTFYGGGRVWENVYMFCTLVQTLWMAPLPAFTFFKILVNHRWHISPSDPLASPCMNYHFIIHASLGTNEYILHLGAFHTYVTPDCI